MFLAWVATVGVGVVAQAGESSRAVETLSEANAVLSEVELRLFLEPLSPEQLDGLDTVFFPLAQHLDLNVLGAGHTARLDPERVFAFVMDALNRGTAPATVATSLVKAYQQGTLSEPQAGAAAKHSPVTIGGFFVVEAEYHQMPTGMFLQLLEINQTRIYFSADVTPDAKDSHVTFLGEWVPVPEEYIHQVTSVDLPSGAQLAIPTAAPVEIPFEQLHAKVSQVGGAPFDLTVGQVRLPFGPWSDFTSHRNFAATKANALVNGFALRKIDLGAQLDGHAGKLTGTFAVLQGRTSAAPTARDDQDNAKDLAARVLWSDGAATLGASAYWVHGDRFAAAGVDWRLVRGPVSLTGEAVYQRNVHPDLMWGDLGVQRVESRAGYLGVDTALAPRWHVYGLYDLWDLSIDGVAERGPTFHVFHGVRYVPDTRVRWVILEYGHLFHRGYDAGNVHVSSQLEITF